MNKTIGLLPRFEKNTFSPKVTYSTSYIEALNSYDYNIIFLSYLPNILEKQIVCCDGFLIPGGDDIDPSLYHQELGPKTKICNPLETYAEKTVIDYAVSNKLPILGICKGLQVLNVFFGGTLHQDINNHWSTKHLVKIGVNEYTVNSFHHQCIDELAPTFKVIGRSTDNIIEAIKHDTLPILAVQWHPEQDLSLEINRHVFDDFQTLLMR